MQKENITNNIDTGALFKKLFITRLKSFMHDYQDVFINEIFFCLHQKNLRGKKPCM